MYEQQFNISVNGLTPICFQPPEVRPPTGVKLDHEDWEKENWSKKLYRNLEGQVVVPTKIIRGSLIFAGRFTDLKPPGRLKSFKPFLENCLLITEDPVLEYDQKKNPVAWVDYPTRGAGKMATYRPVINLPWSCGITLSVFDPALKKAVIEDLFEIAGRICGWGEARKYKSFGRFQATVTAI